MKARVVKLVDDQVLPLQDRRSVAHETCILLALCLADLVVTALLLTSRYVVIAEGTPLTREYLRHGLGRSLRPSS